jgi:phosphatidylserine/phosphatidylglycerophosphate/cardiolipin synthase-like enzyme
MNAARMPDGIRSLLVAGCILLAPAPVALAADGSPAPPIVLAGTRPPETTLGDSTLATAQSVWLDMIKGARQTLDIEQFYVSEQPGEALTPVLGAIGEAAKRGVRVRLLIDASMGRTYPQPAESLGTLENIRLRTIDYRRLAGGVQHAKFMIADGRDAFVGSQNFDWRALSQIHELGARVRIPEVAAAMTDVFETDWSLADTTQAAPAPASMSDVKWPVAFTQDGAAGQVWLSASPRAQTPPSIPWDRDLLVERIADAKREIVLQSLGYGVESHGASDSTLHQGLLAAARRGVRVKLLVSDWAIGGRGEGALRALAAEPNVEVRVSRVPDWSGGYIPFARVEHCKYMVVDGAWLWLGTSNLEPSYFLTSRNLAITMQHAPLARAARGIFERGWSGPTAAPFRADTRLAPRAHGESAPAGTRVYGGR